MSLISTIRHDEIFDVRSNNVKISLIGVGAIGSRVFAALVELGLTRIISYDFDRVEPHNLANQIYSNEDIGLPKVQALCKWYMYKVGFTGIQIGRTNNNMQFINERVDEKTVLAGTVFLMVDSIAARRQIFEENIKGNLDIPLVIDIRMASTHGDIFSFNPHDQNDVTAWEATLFDDKLGEVSACGSSLTVGTTASILSNIAVWQFMHALTNPEAQDKHIQAFLKPMMLTTMRTFDHKAGE